MNRKPTYETLEKKIKELENRITEILRTEKSSRSNEKKYFEIFNCLNDAVYIHELFQEGREKARFVDVNNVACKKLGYSKGELLSMSPDDIEMGRTPEETQTIQKELFEKGHTTFEMIHTAKNGDRIPLKISSRILKFDSKKFVLSIARDITDHKKTKIALKESEKKYRYLFNSGIDAVFVHGLSDKGFGILMDVNKVACERYGYARDEFLRLKIRDIDVGNLSQNVQMAIKERLMAEKHVVYETLHKPKKGTPFPVEINASVIELDGKQAILSNIRDISERKQAENVRKTAHEELEKRVNERTIELRYLSSKLLEAQEEESKRIGKELHDGIAQQLSAIKIWVETAQIQMNEGQPSKALEALDYVVPLTQTAVEEVRRISKHLRPSVLDDLGLLPAISWVCNDFEMIYPEIRIERHIAIRERNVPEHLKIVIFRVLQESLNNVARHSQAKMVRLQIMKVDGGITLSVADDGIGFDVHRMLSGVEVMEGLGFRSMRERTTLSGGSFTVTSSPKEGTTIRASWKG